MSGIDKSIYKAENYSLNQDDILRITDNKTNIIVYSDLEHITDINQILEPYGACCILYQLEENVGHWVCLIKHSEKELEFFGSYGMKIDEQLKYSKYNLRRHNGVETPHLSLLLEHSNYKITYNNVQLQKIKDHTNTCGRWSAMRIRFKDVSIKRFIELFTKNEYYDGDFWISAMSLLI